MRSDQHAIRQFNRRIRLFAVLHTIEEVLHVRRTLVSHFPTLDLFAALVVTYHHPAIVLLHDATFQTVKGRAVVLLSVHKLNHEDDRKRAAVEDRVDVVGSFPVQVLVFADVAGNSAWAIRACDPHRHVQPMRADVSHQPSGVIPEPAPTRGAFRVVRALRRATEEARPINQFRREERLILAAFDVRVNRPIAEIPDAHEADFADAARSDYVARLSEMIAAAPLIADLHDLFRGLDLGDHVLALFDSAAERFFAVSVLDRLHGGDQAIVVQVIGGGDEPSAYVIAREQVVVINLGFFDRRSESFLREFQHAFFDIAMRDDVGAQLLRRGHASRASVTRADAAEPDAIVSADDAGIRLYAHSGSGANRDGRCAD